MTGEFVRTAELLEASWKGATVGFFPSMGSDVTSLMFKSMESFVTHRTLVGPAGGVLLELQGLCFGRHCV